MPVAALIGEGRGLLRERLLELPDLFHALYPPTMEVSTCHFMYVHLVIDGLLLFDIICEIWDSRMRNTQ